MSDTPRTDDWIYYIDNEYGQHEVVDPEKARQLERELNAANERIKQLERDLYVASEKIKRLESWNTQHCNDKANLIETLRYRDGQIKELEGQLNCMTGT